MQGWLCRTLDGPQSLAWATLPTPEPAAGEVRVAIAAASLNFPDLLTVKGQYQFKPDLPFVPGAEYSGHIEALGAGVAQQRPDLAVGQAVACMGSHGGFATHACVNASRVLPLPKAVALEDGAAFAFTYGTSLHALQDRGALKAGESVLILGAAGGVGTAALQIAKAMGAKVIAAAGSDDKAAFCIGLGADSALNYTKPDFREALKAATGGKGPDVVYDAVGGPSAELAFRSIAWRGRYLVVGFAQGQIPALPWNLALLKGAAVVGVFWGDFVRREPSAFMQDMKQLGQWYAQGLVKPVLDVRLPMQELPKAYERMASRQVRGKMLLVNA